MQSPCVSAQDKQLINHQSKATYLIYVVVQACCDCIEMVEAMKILIAVRVNIGVCRIIVAVLTLIMVLHKIGLL